MCGRFVLFTTGEDLIDAVGDLPGVAEVYAPQKTPPPRYNIAPTVPVALVRIGCGTGSEAAPTHSEATTARIDPARWALIPHWKKDLTGPPLFNARAETVREKPSFRDAFATQRGVIPLDGYYEWHKTSGGTVAYFIHLPEGELFWAAALWSEALGQLSCTMVTTAAAEPMAWLHDRLPRFLEREEIEQWCTGTADEAAELLHPAPESLRGRMLWRAADPRVGSVRNDFPELMGQLG